jgi:5'-deoxynucleotidase YfbR-like HD superfamily hydrolase
MNGPATEDPRAIAAAMIDVGRLALAFGRVDRITYHPDGVTAESDTDHTVMLQLIGCALAERHFPHLQLALVGQFALVHDLVEVYAGDTPTLRLPDAAAAAAKNAREAHAYQRIRYEFGASLPWLPRLIARYESQDTPEARYVRALDKLMPKIAHVLNGAVSIAAEGLSAEQLQDRYRQQATQLAGYAGDFPLLLELYQHLVDQVLAAAAAPRRAVAVTGPDTEFRLDIVTGPDPDDPAGIVWFRAASTDAATAQARRHLAAHLGPDDRYGELYRRDGDLAEFLDTIHLGV